MVGKILFICKDYYPGLPGPIQWSFGSFQLSVASTNASGDFVYIDKLRYKSILYTFESGLPNLVVLKNGPFAYRGRQFILALVEKLNNEMGMNDTCLIVYLEP